VARTISTGRREALTEHGGGPESCQDGYLVHTMGDRADQRCIHTEASGRRRSRLFALFGGNGPPTIVGRRHVP